MLAYFGGRRTSLTRFGRAEWRQPIALKDCMSITGTFFTRRVAVTLGALLGLPIRTNSSFS